MKPAMHVAMVLMQGNHSFTGGVPAVVIQRALKLRSDGHDVSIICRASAGLEGHEVREGIHIYPVRPLAKPIEAVFNRLSTTSPFFLLRLSGGLRLAHERLPIDLIDLQDGPAVLGVRKFLFKREIPVSFTIHGSARLNPAPRPWLGRIAHIFYERLAYKTATAVLPVSQFMASAPAAYGFNMERVYVLPNPVGREFRALPRRATYNLPLKMLFLARLVPEKGLATVLRALARLPPGIFQLHIVGDGPERHKLTKLCEALNLNPAPIWMGFISDRAEIAKQMSEAAIFVFPSSWEPQGIALLEAIASGVTPVASNIPAVREVLPLEFCSPPDDPVAWASRFLEISNNPSALSENEEELRDLADKYKVDECYRELSSTYERVIENFKARR